MDGKFRVHRSNFQRRRYIVGDFLPNPETRAFAARLSAEQVSGRIQSDEGNAETARNVEVPQSGGVERGQ